VAISRNIPFSTKKVVQSGLDGGAWSVLVVRVHFRFAGEIKYCAFAP
jgi:hypothetical protein